MRKKTWALSLGFLACGCRGEELSPAPARPAVETGLEVLAREGFGALRGKRVGLITNPAGVDRRLRPAAELLLRAEGVTLAALFGPEHGILGAAAAGVPVADSRALGGVPVHSLYGAVRRPTKEMLQGIDVLLYDLQDVGSRTYTYLSTLRGALEAAAEQGIEVWVLDRPDPLGGVVLDGPVLDPRFESFVGPHPAPLRYGMTPGEFAQMLNAERKIGARLRVLSMTGWRRGMSFEETGLPWVAPSPNIPTPETCLSYPGFVLLEGTNLSEGRGTPRPFTLFGAPWLDGPAVAAALNEARLAGVTFRATEFTPWDSKHRGTRCGAVEVNILDPREFRACAAAAAALAVVRRLHPEELRFNAESFDRLAGGDSLRRALLAQVPAGRIVESWSGPLEDFARRRRQFLIYP